MRSRTLLLVALALCAGCRADSGPSYEFASKTVADRTNEDLENTGHAIVTLPAVVSASFTDGWKKMVRTTELYYDATQTPK